MIKILIASVPDRERVVAELWAGEVQLGEVSNEDGVFRVELSRPDGGGISVLLTDLEKALREARESLVFEDVAPQS
ncbi:MAG TPA: hypothetical protein PK413_18255 [Thermoanaerobaculia bacterium]|nr:hypothetical protein [Thermoanaerobaculia bacterium]